MPPTVAWHCYLARGAGGKVVNAHQSSKYLYLREHGVAEPKWGCGCVECARWCAERTWGRWTQRRLWMCWMCTLVRWENMGSLNPNEVADVLLVLWASYNNCATSHLPLFLVCIITVEAWTEIRRIKRLFRSYYLYVYEYNICVLVTRSVGITGSTVVLLTCCKDDCQSQ